METTHSNDSTPIPTVVTRHTQTARALLNRLDDAIRESTEAGEYVDTSRLDDIDLARIRIDGQQHDATALTAGAGGLWFTATESWKDFTENDEYGEPLTRYRAVRQFVPWQRITSITVLLATKHDTEPY